jgi:hypothetical protein
MKLIARNDEIVNSVKKNSSKFGLPPRAPLPILKDTGASPNPSV